MLRNIPCASPKYSYKFKNVLRVLDLKCSKIPFSREREIVVIEEDIDIKISDVLENVRVVDYDEEFDLCW